MGSGAAMNRPDEPPEAAPDTPNLPDFRKLAQGDFSAVDWRIFWSLLPLVVFLVLNSFWPEDLWRTQVAIVASFAASTWVFAINRDSGVIRFITVLGFVVVAGSAVVGLVADSAKAFAAQNIYSDFLVAAVCLASVAMGKPLVGAVARESIPALRTLMDPRHRVFVILTLVFMTYNIGTGIFRIFLLGEFSANEYVIVSRVTSPISLAFFLACYFMIKRAAGLSQEQPST
ncbi:MAG: hypothetical protein OXE43_10945 [Chloroflexi bacterium]|nr:hypothetical protein [Chloroflexota bacterium]